MGEVEIEGHNVQITLRQSDKARALKLAKRLRNRILDREFLLAERVEKLI
jgi:hypothetical protein